MGRTRRDRNLALFTPKALAMRTSLLESLVKWLSTEPVHKVTVKSVARGANTSPATFYQYFESLDAAIGALLDDLADEVRAELRKRTSAITEGDMYVNSVALSYDQDSTEEDVVAERVNETLEFLELNAPVLAAAVAASIHGGTQLGLKLDTFLDTLGQGLDTAQIRSLKARPVVWMLLAVALLGNDTFGSAYQSMSDVVCQAAVDQILTTKENKNEIGDLKKDSDRYHALLAGGVDNWGGYEDAMASLEED